MLQSIKSVQVFKIFYAFTEHEGSASCSKQSTRYIQFPLGSNLILSCHHRLRQWPLTCKNTAWNELPYTVVEICRLLDGAGHPVHGDSLHVFMQHRTAWRKTSQGLRITNVAVFITPSLQAVQQISKWTHSDSKNYLRTRGGHQVTSPLASTASASLAVILLGSTVMTSSTVLQPPDRLRMLNRLAQR